MNKYDYFNGKRKTMSDFALNLVEIKGVLQGIAIFNISFFYFNLEGWLCWLIVLGLHLLKNIIFYSVRKFNKNYKEWEDLNIQITNQP